MSQYSGSTRRVALCVIGALVTAPLYTIACAQGGRLTPVRAGDPAAARPPIPGAPAEAVAFVDVTVIPMDREQVVPHQTVLVAGGRIAAIGPAADIGIPAGATRIDGQGRFLIPGLSDMHVHLMPSRGTIAAAERRLFLMLANGVTTVRNMDHDDDTPEGVLAIRSRAARGELLSPRIYTAGPLRVNSSTSPGEIAARVAAYKAAGYDFIKMYLPITRECSDSVVAAARRIGLPFAGHVPDDVGIEHALAVKYASIEHLDGYLQALRIPAAGADTALEKDTSVAGLEWQRRHWDLSRIPALVGSTRRGGVWNCPTEAVVESYAMEDLNGTVPILGGILVSQRNGLFETRRRLIKALQDAGAGLLLGTDMQYPSAPGSGVGVHGELRALVDAGLTPYQALATGTRNPAVFLNTSDESGTIQVGKRADLVLLRGNPLADIGQAEAIAGVMVGGQWLSREEIDRRRSALGGRN